MKNQTVLKWTQSTLIFMDESQCSISTGYQLNSHIFYARFPKTCIHKWKPHTGTVTINRSNQHNLLPYEFCKILSLLMNPYNHDGHLGKSMLLCNVSCQQPYYIWYKKTLYITGRENSVQHNTILTITLFSQNTTIYSLM